MLNLNQCFCFSSNVLSLLMSSNGASNEIEQIWYVFVPCYIGHGKQMSFCAACFLSPKQSFFFLDKKGRQCGSKWIKVHQKVQSKWCTHPPIKSQALVRINNIIFSFFLFFLPFSFSTPTMIYQIFPFTNGIIHNFRTEEKHYFLSLICWVMLKHLLHVGFKLSIPPLHWFWLLLFFDLFLSCIFFFFASAVIQV